MKFFMDRNRLYLVFFYFSMSFFYLSFALGEQDPVPMLGYILALIIFIVLSHDTLLKMIVQSTGKGAAEKEQADFSAILELNNNFHNFLEADEVLVLLNDTLKEKVQVKKAVYLLSTEILPWRSGSTVEELTTPAMSLQAWPENFRWAFHTREFEAYLEINPGITLKKDAPPLLIKAFEESGTSLMVPVIENGSVLCVILIERLGDGLSLSTIEVKMYKFLANQLSIILDRIKVYTKVAKKKVMEHAEKIQVMQSLSANIAHEMRTPLAGIRASISGCEEYLPQLMEGYEYSSEFMPEKFPAIREDHRNSMLDTPKRIQLMIDQANTVIDMLLINLRESTLDRKLLSSINAANMLEQAIDRYPFKTGEKEKVTLDLKDNFTFMGVEVLCIYILFNLLKNALYSLQSAQKGLIKIQLEKNEKHNCIVFTDTGLGIDPAISDKIFDRFFTTRSDGTGAGLAFCKRTVNSFSGDISCVSAPGEYTEFRLDFPALKHVR